MWGKAPGTIQVQGKPGPAVGMLGEESGEVLFCQGLGLQGIRAALGGQIEHRGKHRQGSHQESTYSTRISLFAAASLIVHSPLD
jgi:hypothetical protein